MSQSATPETNINLQRGAWAGNTLDQMLAGGRSYSGRERNCCFLNTTGDERASGRFANISATSGLDLINDSRAIGLTDWDQDGDVDMWISNRNTPRLRLMRNEIDSLSPNHFLAFQLIGNGTTTNRDAIGARIEVVLANQANPDAAPRSIETLTAGEGFLSQSSKWVHFGLGNADSVEKVIVHWPATGTLSDNQEIFLIDAVDRRYRLVQGSGQAKVMDADTRQLALQPGPPQELKPTSNARIPFQVLLPAPPKLQYKTFDGRNRYISYDNGPVLINLWSCTCGTCLKELADFTEQAEKLRESGINVFALSVDSITDQADSMTAEKALQKTKFPFASGMATRSLVSQLQELYDDLMPLHTPLPVPTSMLIDNYGRLSVVYKGPVEVDQLIRDLEHSRRGSLERFIESAPLPGITIDDPQIQSALIRQEAAALNRFAKKFERAGQKEQAVAQYRQVLQLKPDYLPAVYYIGTFLTDENRLASARAHYQEALESNPRDVDLHSMLGYVYERESNFEMAQKHYQETVNISPDFAEFRVNLGNILVKQGKLPEAQKEYEEAVRIKPDAPEAQVNLGHVLMQQGKLEEAKAAYENALRANPNFARASLNLGAIWLQQENLELAKQYLQNAIDAQPGYAQAYFNLGRVYAKEGNLQLAKSNLEQAIRFRPDHAEARAMLGRIMAFLRQRGGQ